MRDPFDQLDRLYGSSMGYDDPLDEIFGRSGRMRKRPIQLTPEESESIASQVGRLGLGGLQRIGEVLDTPGALVRDTLAMLGGMDVNPLANVFDPEKRTSGRDLLEMAGILEANQEGFFNSPEDSAGDVAGFLGEVAMDPLTYLTAGLTTAGKLAKAAKLPTKLAGMGARETRVAGTIDDLLKTLPDVTRAQKEADLATAAAKMGVTNPSDLSFLRGQQLGTAARFGVPFTDIGVNILGGNTGRSIARGMDVAGDVLNKLPPVRFARQLFDPAVEGAWLPHDQEMLATRHALKQGAAYDAFKAGKEIEEDLIGPAAKAFGTRFEEDILGKLPEQAADDLPFQMGDVVNAGDRGNYGWVQGAAPDSVEVYFRNPQTGAEQVVRFAKGDAEHDLDQLTKMFGAGSPESKAIAGGKVGSVFDRILREATEQSQGGTIIGQSLPAAMERILPGSAAKLTPELEDAFTTAIQGTLAKNLEPAQEVIEMGGKLGMLEKDLLTHLKRTLPKSNDELADSARAVPVNQVSRNKASRYVGTETLNQMVSDPDLFKKDGLQTLLNRYGQHLGGGYDGDVAQHAEDLHKWLWSLNPDQRGRRMFTMSTAADQAIYQQKMRRTKISLQTIHDQFGKYVSTDTDGVPLAKAFTDIGMDPDKASVWFAKSHGMGNVDALTVPMDVVSAAKHLMEINTKGPGYAERIGRLVDWFNDAFKKRVTVPFPSFVMRNFGSGQMQNLTSDVLPAKDFARYFKQFGTATDIYRHPENYPEIARELQGLNVAWHNRGFEDVPLGPITHGNPLNIKATYREAQLQRQGAVEARAQARKQAAGAGKTDPTTMDVLGDLTGLSGPKGRLGDAINTARDVEGAVLGTGQKLSQLAEWYNRVPLYLYLRKDRGFSAEAAADAVKRLQFDYSELSGFERSVMRRVMPFYSFSRKAAGYVFDELTHRPGGKLAQTVRATRLGRGDTSEPLPEYIAGTTAIPFGGDEENARYITGFGLMHEDPLSLLGGGLQGMGVEGLSRMTPLLKAPLEYLTGESFFQRGPGGGRELTDMDPLIGRLISNVTNQKDPVRLPLELEVLAANSPFSRALSTARQLTDTRKRWPGLEDVPVPGPAALANVLSGVRITDVSEKAQDAILDESTRAVMKDAGAKDFVKTYFPQYMLDQLPPDKQAELLKLQALTNQLAKKKQERAKQAKAKRQLESLAY